MAPEMIPIEGETSKKRVVRIHRIYPKPLRASWRTAILTV